MRQQVGLSIKSNGLKGTSVCSRMHSEGFLLLSGSSRFRSWSRATAHARLRCAIGIFCGKNASLSVSCGGFTWQAWGSWCTVAFHDPLNGGSAWHAWGIVLFDALFARQLWGRLATGVAAGIALRNRRRELRASGENAGFRGPVRHIGCVGVKSGRKESAALCMYTRGGHFAERNASLQFHLNMIASRKFIGASIGN